MTAVDIEQWSELRQHVHRFVGQLSAKQRLENIPTRHIPSGRGLTRNHGLRMELADASDPNKLAAFMRGVTAFADRISDND